MRFWWFKVKKVTNETKLPINKTNETKFVNFFNEKRSLINFLENQNHAQKKQNKLGITKHNLYQRGPLNVYCQTN